ncbi:hypothetical protein CAPTEDRAFT_205112 [Capitella teleta]|uniref:Uncharacterized protein n=1 Tax=Capitella teleta TaxID=283909 RepID=R7TSA4_CAPTE|nr:hypothetical protein CAPTEDRAFT_205112 [Capitella teleta]|eukprot:ELT96783.1 hypothetical protein CAPTEDRAFT_205112 [Capitella teleta]
MADNTEHESKQGERHSHDSHQSGACRFISREERPKAKRFILHATRQEMVKHERCSESNATRHLNKGEALIHYGCMDRISYATTHLTRSQICSEAWLSVKEGESLILYSALHYRWSS